MEAAYGDLAAVDAVAAGGGSAFERLVRRRTTIAIVVANALGALLVFVFLAFVVPVPSVSHPGRLTLLNLAVFVAAMPVGLWIGRAWSLRIAAPTRAWLISGRVPDSSERELALRQPLQLATVGAVLWALAAVLFAGLNAAYSPATGVEAGGTIVLGGLATCALVYLLAERTLRPITALALAAGAPARPVLPGVLTRTLLAWAFGTGIAVLGTGLVAAEFLTRAPTSPRRLAATVLFLSIVALIAGLATALLAARSIADPVDSVRRGLAEVEAGNVAVEVPVDDGSEVGLLQAGFNGMVSGLRERDQIRDLFGRHVGEDVAREALSRGVELGGEVREVSVLFVDIISSTEMAATRDPTVVVEMLNRFFALVIDTVTQHAGWVNKFQGDAALCVFGAPTPRPDAATCALAAARELEVKLRTELPDAQAAIGVSAGPVLAGNVGGADRFEYTVIGDAVNEAARLTELAKSAPSRLLASGAVLSGASPAEARRWQIRESVTLRGKPSPTTIAAPLRTDAARTAPDTAP
jgi:adenylate cyclase